MTATAFYRHARIAGGFKLSLSVHIIKKAPIMALFLFLNQIYLPCLAFLTSAKNCAAR